MNKISIGDQFKHSFSYSQDDVESFARITGDTNPIHLDEAFAKNSIFKTRIMHGFLGASVFTKIFGSLYFADGSIYLKQSLQFLAPMYVDHQYEAIITVKEIFPEKNRVLYATEIADPKNNHKLTIRGEALLMNRDLYVW